MGEGIRCRVRAFTLIEVLAVIAILAVITSIASVAVVKMLTWTREVRSVARSETAVRDALNELTRELHSAGRVQCRPGRTEESGVEMQADTLIYEHNGRAGEPFRPAHRCTVRLVSSGEPNEPRGLVKEVRPEPGREGEVTAETLVENAVGFRVRCLTNGGWTARPKGDVKAVSVTLWVAGTERGQETRAYSTAVNVPRLLWKGGTPTG